MGSLSIVRETWNLEDPHSVKSLHIESISRALSDLALSYVFIPWSRKNVI